MDSWPEAVVPALPGQAPEIKVWDTASGELAVAAPGRLASIYACGITPYDATHMGHAATYVAWDLLVRAWRDAGHEVRYVQNVTDVDDPLLERAQRDGEDWRELAAREIARYRSDMTALRVLPPAELIGAVEALPLIEAFNDRLDCRGSLYELEGDTYFARSADPAFGSVSRLDPATMAELSAERGGDPERPGKKDPLDPMVWLGPRPGEPSWPSDLGPGRPGWHVECAAIATHYLGESFDIQAGGSDLIYPHHEMSASHARVGLANSHAFAQRFAHAGMVRLDGEKMSKSLGNLVFVSKLREAGVDPMAIRLALLDHHYQADWDWTDEGLVAAQRRLARWREAVARAESGADVSGGRVPGGGVPGGGVPGADSSGAGGSADGGGGAVLAAVRERLADDLDAPGALAAVDAWADAVLAGSPGGSGGSAEAARLVRATVDALLGIAL